MPASLAGRAAPREKRVREIPGEALPALPGVATAPPSPASVVTVPVTTRASPCVCTGLLARFGVSPQVTGVLDAPDASSRGRSQRPAVLRPRRTAHPRPNRRSSDPGSMVPDVAVSFLETRIGSQCRRAAAAARVTEQLHLSGSGVPCPLNLSPGHGRRDGQKHLPKRLHRRPTRRKDADRSELERGSLNGRHPLERGSYSRRRCRGSAAPRDFRASISRAEARARDSLRRWFSARAACAGCVRSSSTMHGRCLASLC